MKYKIVSRIKSEGYPVSSPDYPRSHEEAQKYERQKYGKRRFKALEMIIKERIPKGELAGSHTKEGEILVSKKIPEEYHNQIVHHERFEHRFMERKRKVRIRKTRRTKRRSC